MSRPVDGEHVYPEPDFSTDEEGDDDYWIPRVEASTWGVPASDPTPPRVPAPAPQAVPTPMANDYPIASADAGRYAGTQNENNGHGGSNAGYGGVIKGGQMAGMMDRPEPPHMDVSKTVSSFQTAHMHQNNNPALSEWGNRPGLGPQQYQQPLLPRAKGPRWQEEREKATYSGRVNRPLPDQNSAFRQMGGW